MLLISKKMRAFMLVARLKSISDAAKALSLTVSPVSRLISELEIGYKKKLFIRQGNRISLSKDGTALYNQIEKIYDKLYEIEMQFKRINVNNVNIINHDWGKDAFTLKYQYNALGFNKKVRFNFVSSSETFKDNNIYLTSDEVTAHSHVSIIFKEIDSLVLYANDKFDITSSPTILFLFPDQVHTQPVKEYLEKIHKQYKITKTIILSSEMGSFEMVKNGHGIGITMRSYLESSVWGANKFRILDTGTTIDYFFYIPKNPDEPYLAKALQELMKPYATHIQPHPEQVGQSLSPHG